ncbi:MAG: hypothetical protein MUP14_06615 [Dehalococcoidia bacterium]|nr:hypothetical protein [Dehalococcoidia bacterium]
MGEFLDALSDFAIQWELWAVGSTLRRIREEQWLAASRIVAGLESVREAVDELRASVDNQTQVLERGFATLDARLDFQAHVLGKVLDTLYRPSEVRARELRERGERALHARLYEDALTDFEASLGENRYDFTCHFAVGAIQWEQLGNEEAARTACDLALRYAQVRREDSEDPSPSFYSSLALLLMGRISEAGGSLDAALRYYADACLASPDYGDCFRYYARAAARLGRTDLALPAIRASILIDEGQAVLIEQDEILGGLGQDLLVTLASIQSESKETARRLSDLAGEARVAFRTSLEECKWIPAAEFRSALARIDEVVAEASELERRGGFLDLARASRGYCRSLADLASEASALKDRAEEHIQSSERRVREEAASLEAEAEQQAQNLSAEEKDRSSRMSCALWLILLLILPWPVGSYIASLGVSGEDALAFRIICAFSSVGFLLMCVLAVAPNLGPSAKERLLSTNIGALRRSARKKMLEVKGLQKSGQAVSRQLTTLDRISAAAARLRARPEIECSLILLDSGARHEGYDEANLAEALIAISRRHSGSKPLSPTEAKDLIRDCPRVFQTGLSIPDAEGIAAHLRREFSASVGIKRRFIGEFPPRAKAIEAPLALT